MRNPPLASSGRHRTHRIRSRQRRQDDLGGYDGHPPDPRPPVLDGRLAGNEVIRDTDKGAIDGDPPTHDRAVGPMQFIPATWAGYASDGNGGDGIKDPNNVFDAALSAAKYLCSGGLNLRDVAQETKAVLRYNNSATYAANVIMWSTAYKNGVIPSGQLPYTSGINTGSSAINAAASADSAASAVLAAAAATDPAAGDKESASTTPTPDHHSPLPRVCRTCLHSHPRSRH